MTGVPRIITRLVAYCAHTNSGSRNHVRPGARMRCTVTMKLKPVRIDEKPATNDADRRQRDGGRRRRSCCTACRTSSPCRGRRRRRRRASRMRADDVEVPAQQVDPRERQVLRAAHDRDQEVAERRRNRRDQEEEDHHHAVQREQLVVHVRRQQVALRRQQLEPDAEREQAADREEDRDRDQVQHRDALVVLGQEPRRDAVRRVEIAVSLLRTVLMKSSYLPAAAALARPASAS